MPIPKLFKDKGTPVPDWNLSPSALKKAQEAFRASAAAMSAAAKTTARGTKKAARKAAAKKAATKKAATKKASASKASAAASRVVSPHVLFRRVDLISDRLRFRRRWEDLIRIWPRRRKNQKNMTPTEWSVYINAINTIASPGAQSPTYQEFVSIHVQAMDMSNHAAHSWGVHTMFNEDGTIAHVGTNFLAWHREYISKLEARLLLVNPAVVLPYWDWINDRAIPPQLSNPSDLSAWGITRGTTFNPNSLPDQSDINSVKSSTTFTAFQTALESPHGWVHNAVGGTMRSSSSPADPLFWLHHAMVDKIWADWEKANPGASFNPPNMNETLKPPPIITSKVSEVVNTSDLGYVYV